MAEDRNGRGREVGVRLTEEDGVDGKHDRWKGVVLVDHSSF